MGETSCSDALFYTLLLIVYLFGHEKAAILSGWLLFCEMPAGAANDFAKMLIGAWFRPLFRDPAGERAAEVCANGINTGDENRIIRQKCGRVCVFGKTTLD